MKPIILFYFMTLVLACSYGQTADELIRKNLEARGGAEFLSKIKNVKIDQVVTQGSSVTHSIYYAENHDKFRFEQIQNDKLAFALVTNGATGWMVGETGRVVKIPAKDAFFSSEADGNPLGPLYEYKQRGYSVEFIRKDTLKGSDVYVLKVNMIAMQQLIYLDAKTLLERKVDRGVINAGKESSYIMWYDDYKPVNGVLFPHSVQSFLEGQKPYQIKRTTISANVDSKHLFTPEREQR